MSDAISSRFMANAKSRSAPARLTYSKQTPITGVEAIAGQTIRLKLPSNRVGTYFDPEASFLQFKVNLTGATGTVHYSPAGVQGLIQNIVVRNTGNYLSTVDRSDIYSNIVAKNFTPSTYVKHHGRYISGLQNADVGDRVTTTDKTVRCIYLSDLGYSLFQCGSYIPLFSSDSIEIDIVLGSSTFGLGGTTSTSSDAGLPSSTVLKLEEIQLNLAVIEVPPPVDGAILKQHGGMFKYLVNNVGHFQSSIQSGVSSHTFNVGMSYSSLNKVTAVLIANNIATNKHQNSVFGKHGIKKATLMVDGVPVMNALGIECSATAVNLCYNRIAHHALTDLEYAPNVHTAHANLETDNYIITFDLDTIAGKSDSLRSGLNVSASTSQIILEFESATSQALDLHVFAHYDAMISMDINGTRNFEISV